MFAVSGLYALSSRCQQPVQRYVHPVDSHSSLRSRSGSRYNGWRRGLAMNTEHLLVHHVRIYCRRSEGGGDLFSTENVVSSAVATTGVTIHAPPKMNTVIAFRAGDFPVAILRAPTLRNTSPLARLLFRSKFQLAVVHPLQWARLRSCFI